MTCAPRSLQNLEGRSAVTATSPKNLPTQVNPLWGAPRIHGELLKLGIDLSLATVGRYVPRRPKILSQTWQSSLHNHLTDTLAQRPQ
jgi:hypothetical protein